MPMRHVITEEFFRARKKAVSPKGLSAARRPSPRALLRIAAASVGCLVTGCADDDTTKNFPPLTYTYLTPLHLNVAHIDIVDHAPPGSVAGDVSALAPESPQQALEEMARDRLIASGTQDASATFTITHAAILHEPGGTLQGNLDVQIAVASQDGARVGQAEAHVSRSYSPGDDAPESRSALYAITAQMMQDMNVEMEYQVKHSLASWLVDASGAPLDGGVQQQSLTSSAPSATTDESAAPPAPDATPQTGAPPVATQESAPAPAAPPPPSTPDAIFPTGGPDTTSATAPKADAATQEHSPKPGVLQMPAPASPDGTSGQ